VAAQLQASPLLLAAQQQQQQQQQQQHSAPWVWVLQALQARGPPQRAARLPRGLLLPLVLLQPAPLLVAAAWSRAPVALVLVSAPWVEQQRQSVLLRAQQRGQRDLAP
jgi:hypothetical protein